MKVGIVTEWFDRGSAFVSLEFQRQLELQGHEIFIYARSEALELNQQIWPGAHVHIGKAGKVNKAKSVERKDFESWIDNQNLTHVIFNEQIWIPPVIWAKKRGVLIVCYVDYYTRKTIKSFKIYDALICNTERHYSLFKWHPNAWFIPWGTDIKKFQPKENFSHDDLVFIHSAGWSPYRKGTDLVVKSFLSLTQENIKLRIHGQINLATWLQSMNLYEEVKMDTRIELLQEKTLPQDFFRSGDVYVYPSRLDGIGLTQPEALAAGLPIIVPDEPPMREFALDPYSRKVPIVRRWRREDDYFWDMTEVDVVSLRDSLLWFSNRIHEKESWSRATRSFAITKFDIDANLSVLGKLMSALAPNDFSRTYLLVISLRYGASRIQSNFLTPTYAGIRNRIANVYRKVR
jgi:glycosyltransferase involved in cell wall biosynthesis